MRRLFPDQELVYARLGWRLPPSIDRVCVNRRARDELGWRPRVDFRYALDRLAEGGDWRSPVALAVGATAYHAQTTGPCTLR